MPFVKLKYCDSIHYLDFGKGKTLVLLPSLWVTSKSYTMLGGELAEKYRVLIPDLYRGESKFRRTAKNIDDYVEQLYRFLEKLHITDCYLVGISASGATATKFVLKYPDLVKKLFLISSSIISFKTPSRKIALFWGYLKLFFHNFYSLKGIATNLTWAKDGLLSGLCHPKQAIMEGLITTTLENEEIKALPIPTKLLFAKSDEFIPLEVINKMQNISNLQLEILDEHHAWFFGREGVLARKIFSFFTN